MASLHLSRILELDYEFRTFSVSKGSIEPRPPRAERSFSSRSAGIPVRAQFYRQVVSHWNGIGFGENARLLRSLENRGRSRSRDWGLLAGLGRVKQNLGRLDAAIQDFRTALEGNPKWLRGYGWLGEALIQAGDYRAGIESLRVAGRHFPDDPWVLAWLGAGYDAAGSRGRALRAWDKALALEPDCVELQVLLGKAGRADVLDAAIKRSSACIWSWIVRGHFRLRGGEYAGAENDFSKVIAMDPLSSWAYVMRAWARRGRSDFSGQERDIQRAVDLDPANVIGVLESIGREGYLPFPPYRAPTSWIADQVRALERSLRSGGTDPLIYALLADLRSSNDVAMGDIRGGLRRHPNDPVLLAFQARAYGKLGKQRGAAVIDLLSKAIEMRPRAGWMLAWRAEALKRSGSFREALRDINRSIGINPLYPFNFCWRGGILAKLGNLRGALRDFDRQSDFIPRFAEDFGPCLREREAVLFRNGMKRAAVNEYVENAGGGEGFEWSEEAPAEKHLRDLSGAARDSSEAAIRAEALLRSNSLKGAKAMATRAIGLNPNCALAYSVRAEALARLGRKRGAYSDIEKAIVIRPRCPRFYSIRAHVSRSLGNDDDALKDLDRLHSIIWRSAGYHVLRARLNRLRGRARAAVSELTDLLAVNPGFGWAHYERSLALLALGRDPAHFLADLLLADIGRGPSFGLQGAAWSMDSGDAIEEDFSWLSGLGMRPAALGIRGVLAYGLGRTRAALSNWNLALNSDGKTAWVLAWKADCLLQRGQAERALAALESALAECPRFSWAWLMRAKANISLGRLAQAALDLEKSLALGESWEAFAQRGWLRRAQGDPARAVADFDRSIELNSRQSWVHYWRGESCARLNDWPGARESLNEALFLHPGYSDAARLRAVVEERLRAGAGPA